jgi:serine/threonine-protein kinase
MTEATAHSASVSGVEPILLKYLEAVEAGLTPDRPLLLARHPDFADELAAFFAEYDRVARLTQAPEWSVSDLAGTPTLLVPPPGDAAPPGSGRDPATAATAFGDYELLEEMGRGGMGVVWKARQKSLNRLVALKMIGSWRQASGTELRRFRIEAEAAAQLEHPAIVPIYEVGELDGRPYFSMKLIEGGSLEGRLSEFQSNPRATARLLATVARAVHYAHRYGILHRDLKPANILLSTGESGAGIAPGAAAADLADCIPHVTDFGLAKRVGAAEEQPQSEGEPAVAPTAALTQYGCVLGTPNYMAPEQADPTLGPVTTAADVYGLGAILYAMLTGRAPFRGATVMDTLQQVANEPAQPPRSLYAGADRDLEVICLKCLAKAADERYASAEDLAEELERWLAGEPIQARRHSALERALKWTKRRPAATGLLVVSAAAVIALAAGGLWYGSQLRAALADARERRRAAEQESRRAEQNFRLAVKAVEDMVRHMEADDLPHLPAVERIRQTVLLDALEFNKQFLAEKSDDLAVRYEAGRAYRRAGDIYRLLGRQQEALAAYDEARALQEDLTRSWDRVPEYRHELACTEHNRGTLLEAEGRFVEAETALRAALILREKLADEQPDDPERQGDLAGTLHELGGLLNETGRIDEAEAPLRQAADLGARLVKQYPAVARYQYDRARFLGSLGRLLAESGKPRGAEEAYRGAIDACRSLVEKYPKEPEYRKGLARARINRGVQLHATWRQDSARLAEAQKELETARDLCRDLVKEFPDAPDYRQELARSLANLGLVYREDTKVRPRQKAAEDALREALDIRLRLVSECPTAHRSRQELARTYNFLGKLFESKNALQEAEDAYRAALAAQRALTADCPSIPVYRNDLGNTLNNLGDLCRRRQGLDEAVWFFDQAIASQESALRDVPRHPQFRAALVRDYDRLAKVLAQQKKAAALVEKAAALRKGVVDGPDVQFLAARLFASAIPLLQQDEKLSVDERAAFVRSVTSQAIDSLRAAVDKGFKDAPKLKAEIGFTPLRGRDDFRQLQAEVEKRAANTSR